MLVASGPTLLSVALARELHGQGSVAGAAVAFSAGCLQLSRAVELAGRRQPPATLVWPLWGIGMLAGWILAPYHVLGLFLAQFLAGLEHDRLRGRHGRPGRPARARRYGHHRARLVAAPPAPWAAPPRSGSYPVVVAAPAIGLASGVVSIALASGALTAWLLLHRRGYGGSDQLRRC